MARATWGSRLGFVLAVAGSAVGLANIWKFPFTVGKNGGAAFIAAYLIALALIGFPVLMAEILIGRKTHRNPSGAFGILGGKIYSWFGKATILTGFIVSSFYSAIAGWILGYLVEAIRGQITHFTSASEAAAHFHHLQNSPFWGIGFHMCFITLALFVLYAGVRSGIERYNKVLMPMLFILLILLVIRGITMPGAGDGIAYLLSPDWQVLTPIALLSALGQAFFTLSLGQGTMVTYGSYLKGKENLLQSCIPVVAMDTCVSLLSAIAVFSIVFAVGMHPDSGPSLIFQTLPLAFSQMPMGTFFAFLFFLLVVLAALTSQISAMEPTIAYLMDEKGWKRHKATVACVLGAFLLGIPSALPSSVMQSFWPGSAGFLDLISFLAVDIMIPLGGLMAILLVGWVWGTRDSIDHLVEGMPESWQKNRWLTGYFRFSFRYSAPILIVIVLLSAFFSA